MDITLGHDEDLIPFWCSSSNIEACTGVLGVQDICHFTSRDKRYFSFYSQVIT